jgi:AcrR family transcriptional regulator
MSRKSDLTKTYIIEQVAPIFNKKGYAATSMTDICSATDLTKGAIYGNFNSKEELSIFAFRHNVKKVIVKISEELAMYPQAHDKLFALSNFYRKYYDYTLALGGCPILNIGVDANHQNSVLLEEVKRIILKLENNIFLILQQGVLEGVFKPDLDCDRYSKRIFSMIEGSIFMSVTMKKESYIMDMMDLLDQNIRTEIML